MMATETQLTLPPLALYIHIPWCVKKCPYCDFNSHTFHGQLPEKAYINALLNDLDQELPFVQGRSLQSIFFGGGTPSLFSAEAIDTLLTAIKRRIPFAPHIEITLEANPGTVEQHKFIGFRQAGINRLSIGVQSFNAQQLKKLGRIHNNQEAVQAAAVALKAGFSNFNIDLMHGLEGQTTQQALADLEQAIALSPSHISWYQLTIEPNTVFYKNPPLIPHDDQLADIQLAGEDRLASKGFIQYEVSAYAQQGKESQHNLNYWLFGDYIGIGAGAHGKITHLNSNTLSRNWKSRSPNDYLNTLTTFEAGTRTISTDERPLEFMMNALRLNQGFTKTLFEQRTGIMWQTLKPSLHELNSKGLTIEQGNQLKTTSLGRQFLNDILEYF